MAEVNRKHMEKINVTVEQKIKGEFTYWKKWVWNKDEPLVMVLDNYPVTGSVMKDSLTGILIRNAIVDCGTFGGVVIANLFNAQVKWPCNKRLDEPSYHRHSVAKIVFSVAFRLYIDRYNQRAGLLLLHTLWITTQQQGSLYPHVQSQPLILQSHPVPKLRLNAYCMAT